MLLMRIAALAASPMLFASLGASASANTTSPAQKAVTRAQPWTCPGDTRTSAQWITELRKAPTKGNWKNAVCNYRKNLDNRQKLALTILSPLIDPVDGQADLAETAYQGMQPGAAVRAFDEVRKRATLTPAQATAREESLKEANDNLELLNSIEPEAIERRDPKRLLTIAEMRFDAGNDNAKAAKLFSAGLASGLNGQDIAVAQTFLAIIAYKQGDKAVAAKRFAGIPNGSPWRDVADLWQAYLTLGVRG